jgi:hypothetical protein
VLGRGGYGRTNRELMLGKWNMPFSWVWKCVAPGLESALWTSWWESWDWSLLRASWNSLNRAALMATGLSPGPPHRQCPRKVRERDHQVCILFGEAMCPLLPYREIRRPLESPFPISSFLPSAQLFSWMALSPRRWQVFLLQEHCLHPLHVWNEMYKLRLMSMCSSSKSSCDRTSLSWFLFVSV